MSTYKGIDKEAILKIKEVRFPQAEKDIVVDLAAVEDSFDIMRKALETHQKMLMNDTEMSIICEMALKYLDGFEAMKDSKVKAYNKGLEDAWELARKLYANTAVVEIKKIYDIEDCEFFPLEQVLKNFTPQEALAKLEAYEKAQAEIKVGDVVEIDATHSCGIVIAIDEIQRKALCLKMENLQYVIGIWYFSDLIKTGKHIDIQSALEQIGGGTSEE